MAGQGAPVDKGHRYRHITCGFALQLVTVRYLRCLLTDPLEVQNEVLDVVAAQLQLEAPSCVKCYTERDKTRLEQPRCSARSSGRRWTCCWRCRRVRRSRIWSAGGSARRRRPRRRSSSRWIWWPRPAAPSSAGWSWTPR
ncbi:MAG: DUF4158 domain-containing protein [Hamadaea sp.]|nr:DUF4158 domain-containing protein [Hamadaea sp.]